MSDLFYEWKQREIHVGKRFIEDGIIDPQRWSKISTRVLFILKEAYDTREDGQGFNLPALLREKWKGPKGATWIRMAEWAHLLQNYSGGRAPDLPSDRNALKEAILSSAVVNIRKSDGEKASKKNTISEYAKTDRDLLRQQIDEISPNVIVCGNTWDAAKWFLSDAKKVSTRFSFTERYTIIAYWHPAARLNKELMYFGLAGIYQNGLKCLG